MTIPFSCVSESIWHSKKNGTTSSVLYHALLNSQSWCDHQKDAFTTHLIIIAIGESDLTSESAYRTLHALSNTRSPYRMENCFGQQSCLLGPNRVVCTYKRDNKRPSICEPGQLVASTKTSTEAEFMVFSRASTFAGNIQSLYHRI
jgi:hypothetical protein